jgi:hypothetical protein
MFGHWNKDSDVLPQGVKPYGLPHGRVEPHFSLDTIRRLKIEAGRHHHNTFAVTPEHVKLPPDDGTGTTSCSPVGVRFNVETVPEPLQEHLHKTKLSRDSVLESLQVSSASAYSDQDEEDHFDDFSTQVSPQDVRIEALSSNHDNLIHQGGNGFLVACLTAFAQHLPLKLSPDHIWSLITYAFAKHVDQNAEELRSKFVSHQGKKRLLVTTPDDFRMSDPENNGTGASPEEWERFVFGEFSEQIREHIGDETHATVTAAFTTTTPISRAAFEISLMAATKNYFSFGMSTCCGIPCITLLGTEQDWVSLRNRAQDLSLLMVPTFSEYWMPLLLPVLDQFVESYRGNVNHGFWQSMVKLRHNGMESGYAEFISGWMQILFPYLDCGTLNKKLRPWEEMYFQGPDPNDFPPLVSTVPVDWDYHGVTFNMDFSAGISGISQDEDGTLAPVVGWYVTHTPPMPASERLAEVKDEIDALHRGHADEASGDEVDATQPWYQRVQVLREEQAKLEKK